MRIGRVTGTVVATAKVDSLRGKRLLIVQPVNEKGVPYGDPLVALDSMSAAPGETVCFEEKREAAKAFPGPDLPSDATILGIVDHLEAES